MKKEVPVIALLLAAGKGIRYGAEKQFVNFDDKPLMFHSLDTMCGCDCIQHIFPVLSSVLPSALPAEMPPIPPTGKLQKTLKGGATRFDSIRLSLAQLDAYEDDAIVLVHDAARPLAEPVLFNRCVSALETYPAVTTAVAISDSLAAGDGGLVRGILPREKHFYIQTPQGARLGLLRAAYAAYSMACPIGKKKLPNPNLPNPNPPKDDCEVILAYDADTPIGIVEGSRENIKLTRPDDLAVLSALAERRRQREK